MTQTMDLSKYRWYFLILGIVLWSASSYVLWTQPFWSYWPMIWMLSAWLIFTSILWGKLTGHRRAYKRWLLSTMSGLLLAFSFPTSPFFLAVFVGFVPLLLLESQLERDGKGSSIKIFGHAFNAFLLWNVITTFWVLNTSFIPGIAANTINAALMALVFLIFSVMRKRIDSKLAYLGFIAFWMSFEYIHLQWEISWPWLNLGNTFAHVPQIVQWYDMVGCPGGALWVLSVNVLMFFGLKNARSLRQIHWRSFVKPLAILLVPIIASLIMYWSHEDRGKAMNAVLVQPNYEPHYQKFDIPMPIQVKAMSALASDEINDSTDLVVFPETVIDRVRLNNVESNSGIKAFRALVAPFPNAAVLSGISSMRIYKNDSLINKATRTHVSEVSGDITLWDIQNSAILLATQRPAEVYFKSKLVPGAEIFPYRDFLPFIKPLIAPLGGSAEGHVTQEERTVFEHNGFKLAPVICYESIYGEYVGDYIKNGAEAIVVMTNDGWWDDTPGHKQHLALSRLRAVEHRRSIARSANTGISCFIDQRGDIKQPTKYEEAIAIQGKIKMNSELTFYTRWGDYWSHIANLVSLMFIFALLARMIKSKQ